MKKIKIGFVGCGSISGIYFKNITGMFREIEIVGVCDLIRERAENAVKTYGIPKLYNDMYELFNDPEVDIVLNITRPAEHYAVSKAALLAGKNVYSEKPLAASLENGKELVELAASRGLLLGGAPDTFMGAGIQTCRRLIDSGEIGQPIGGAGFMICHGHETWHPDPEFYYKHGGGPLMDMGPYYLTAMINLLGGVSSVSAMTKKSFEKRTITSQPHNGEIIDVDVSTYTTGIMRFCSGAICTLFTTFDVYYPDQARVEIYGSEGTLYVPDPNGFGGSVKIFKLGKGEEEIPLEFDYGANNRALGLADMANALLTGRKFRTNCNQTYHVLEIMEAFIESGKLHREVEIKSVYERMQPMKRSTIGIIDY